MEKTYKIVKKNKNINYAIILKTGLTAEITIASLGKEVRDWTKLRGEMFANSAIAQAKMKNIEDNYPMVKKMSDEQLTAARLYLEAKTMHQDNTKDLSLIKKNVAFREKELPALKKQLGIIEETDLDMAIAEFYAQKDIAGDALKDALKSYGKIKTR